MVDTISTPAVALRGGGARTGLERATGLERPQFSSTLTWKRQLLERRIQESFQGHKQTQRALVHYLGCEALPRQVFGRYENS